MQEINIFKGRYSTIQIHLFKYIIKTIVTRKEIHFLFMNLFFFSCNYVQTLGKNVMGLQEQGFKSCKK